MVTEDEWGPLQEQQWDIVQSFFLWERGGAMLQGWRAGSELAFGKILVWRHSATGQVTLLDGGLTTTACAPSCGTQVMTRPMLT